jgi:hypothetical protein
MAGDSGRLDCRRIVLFVMTILATAVGIMFSLVFRDLAAWHHLSVPLRRVLYALTGSEAALAGRCVFTICTVFPSFALQVALSFCALTVSPNRTEDVSLLFFALGCGILVEVSQSIRVVSTFDPGDLVAVLLVYAVFRVSVLRFG